MKVTVNPGNRGIAFRYKGTRWAALPELISDTKRCTKLGEISTIEHLMSAFAGIEISDAEVEVSAPELPAMDGSSKQFVTSLIDMKQSLGETELRDPFSRIFVQEEDIKIGVSAGNGHWRYVFETKDRWPGTQVYETSDVNKDYVDQIAPARTFGFVEEIPFLVEMGLARGLDLEKALVIGDTGYNNFAVFETEPARHKMLDIIGDLFLSGVPIKHLNVVAERSGHRANVKAAGLLRQAVFGPL